MTEMTLVQLPFRAGLSNTRRMGDTKGEEADILALIESRFRSAARARLWFENEALPGFGGQTAQELVRAGRAADVQDFIGAVDAGVHS